MDPETDQEPKRLKAWKPPTVRKLCELNEDEVARLRAAQDPIALLFEMKPELKSRS